MNEKKTKPLPWNKEWRASWRDERLDDLSDVAVRLRPCLKPIAHSP